MGEKSEYVPPRIVGQAIEAIGIFITIFLQFVEKDVGYDLNHRAWHRFCSIPVVEDVMTAVIVGVRDIPELVRREVEF